MLWRFSFLILAVGLLAMSCKKDKKVVDPPVTTQPPDTTPASVVFSFSAVVNGKPLVTGNTTYTNTSGDSYSVSRLNYFVSLVKLKRADGSYYAEKESYHLIKHASGLTTLTLTGVPPGNYTGLEFLIGVDSTRNVSGAQTGALDPGNEMFWDWNTGYIFFKLEGDYKTAKLAEAESYAIHIGGFTGEYNVLQTYTSNFAQTFEIKAGKQARVYFKTNVDEIFENPKRIGFDYYYANVNLKTFQMIAANYKDMFSIDKLEN